MTVESVTYISDFNVAYPAAGDLKSEGDDHIRNIKTGVKGSFPNLVGAASPGSMGTSLGLVGTPAYSFTGDADTGMWSPAANTLAWSTNGAEGMRLDVNGALGIGVGATASTKLHIKGAGATARARVESTSGVIGEMQADTANSLIVGTVSNYPLDIITNSATRLRLTEDGRIYATGIHNNAGAVTGTTNQYLASGTYTPTLTNVTNVTASTAAVCQWMRVGNVVTVSGTVSIDPAVGSTASQLDLSLPIASNFVTAIELGGTAVRNQGTAGPGLAGAVIAETVNDRASILFTCDTDAANRNWSFHFTYVVL